MRSWFMLQRWRLRTKTRGVWKGLVRAVRIRLLQLQPAERLAYVLPLIVLGVSLAACATNSPPSVPAVNPVPPRLSEPLPSESYLDSARRLMENWRNALTGM